MINALSYGAPPHGVQLPGLDRIVMLLAGKENIREVTFISYEPKCPGPNDASAISGR